MPSECDLPTPDQPVYCEACSKILLKYGAETSTTLDLMAQSEGEHEKTCHVDAGRNGEILKGHEGFLKRFHTTMFNSDPLGFKVAASSTYDDSTTFDTSRPNVCKDLPDCDLPPDDELAHVELIDGLVGHIGHRLGIDDLTIRYLVDHTATYRISKLSSCLPMIVSYMIDRHIANPHMNATYEWWLKRTQRYRALSHEELQSFIHRESQKKRRWTVTSAPEIEPWVGLDYTSMAVCEIAAACLFGGSQREVQECLLMDEKTTEHSPYSSRSPVALAVQLLWIQHSGRHNHLEDAFGAHHIPTLEAWQEFIKDRRQSRSLPEIADEVIEHIRTLYAGRQSVPELDNCLATPDQFAKVLENMDRPPSAHGYTLDDIRQGVMLAVENLNAQKQAERADLRLVAQAMAPPVWNQNIARSLGLPLMIMGTTASDFLAAEGKLHEAYLSHLKTTRLGKAIGPQLRAWVERTRSEIDQWIKEMKEDANLFEKVKADELKLAKQAGMTTRQGDSIPK